MKTSAIRRGCLVAMIVSVVVLAARALAEPPDQSAPGAASRGETTAQDYAEPRVGVLPEWGAPLVDDLTKLRRLDLSYPVWVDKEQQRMVLLGSVAMRVGPLELFACLLNSKEHESIVSVNSTASLVQAGLLAVGAQAGAPVQLEPKYEPARGTEIKVTVVWKDQQGRRQTAQAQEWIRRAGSSQSMKEPWVFAGGRFWRERDSGREVFSADMTGDLISVSNFPDAMLDVPIASTTSDAALLFEAFTERIPPRGTPVTILLQPQAPAQVTSPSQPPRR